MKRLSFILLILFCNNSFGTVFFTTDILKLISQKKYLKAIHALDDSLANKPAKAFLLTSNIEYSSDVQVKLYLKLRSMLLAITSHQLTMTSTNIKIMQQILEISDDFNLDTDKYDFDELLDIYEIEIENWNKSKFIFNYFVSLSYMTWNYSLTLTDSTGKNATLYSKERGPCVGAGIRYQNASWGIESGLCYGYISATVGEDSKNIKYNQSKVPVDTLISTTKLIWRPKDRVSLKIGMPIVYHNGNYKSPIGGSIRDNNEISFGYLISSEWLFSKIAFEISYGDLKNYPSSFWSFKIIFNL